MNSLLRLAAIITGLFTASSSLAQIQTISTQTRQIVVCRDDGTLQFYCDECDISRWNLPDNEKFIKVKTDGQIIAVLTESESLHAFSLKNNNSEQFEDVADFECTGNGDVLVLKNNGDRARVELHSVPAKSINHSIPRYWENLNRIEMGNRMLVGQDATGKLYCISKQAYDSAPRGSYKMFDVGGFHAVAVSHDNNIKCWGQSRGKRLTPPNVRGEIVDVSAGFEHSCVLTNDGTVKCWGENYYGQCDPPRDMGKIIDIDCGLHHSVALNENGKVFFWGRGDIPNNPATYDDSSAESPLRQEYLPPILEVDLNGLSVVDSNRDNILESFEEVTFAFEIKNIGPGPAKDLQLKSSLTKPMRGIEFTKIPQIPIIPPGGNQTVEVTIKSNRFIEQGEVGISIEVLEPGGFGIDPFVLKMQTLAFNPPRLEVVDYKSSHDTWTPNTPITIDLLVQNVGLGDAESITITTEFSDGVVCFSSNLNQTLKSMNSGESSPIIYDILVPRTYQKDFVEISVVIAESFEEYGSTWTQRFNFENQNQQGQVLHIQGEDGQGQKTESTDITMAQFTQSRDNEAKIQFNEVPKDVIVETVAVVPVDGKDCNGKTVSGQDIASFTEGSLLGLYNVVERRNLERVLDEQRLALSGVLYEKSAVEAGCNVGAQGIIFTEYGCLTGQETIQLKLVDCQTSELYWSATGVNATAQETLDKVRQELERQ